ncbi:zinc-binding dehydrogenase [Pseudoduganella sp. FT26W]|uniref:Zinc-binding dehydrogenase n=1 Tax=Duganella aquatilis TaxID=2666082 RepID=A0A844D9V7_9BURK|nr:NAD(P)-dependent alcohol dehydrogenase [Duganella aquatilis]MRW85036.1 zinc-binding dehydrogenase [Duganella aquatilis]
MDYTTYRTDGQGGLRRVQTAAAPLPSDGVRVAVRAVGVNFRDVYVIRGNRYRAPAVDQVPMTDAAGVVVEVGSEVTRFKVGDRVCSTVLPNWIDGPLSAHGMARSTAVLAEYFDAGENDVVAAPPHLSDIEAATLPVAALTAWHAVAELGVVGAGDTVVVQTTGGVAVFAMQFAQALGARVIVVSRSRDKLERTGAWAAINTETTPEWDQQVLALTGGHGARLVLDMGLDDSLRRSARAAAYEGTVAIIGVVQQQTNPLDIYTVMNKNLNVRGVETGSRAMFERMNRFMAEHGLRPHIDSVHDDVDAALDRIASSPYGKVVLNPRC